MKKIAVNALSALAGGGVTYIKSLLEYVPEDVQVILIVGTRNSSVFREYESERVVLSEIGYASKSVFHRILWEKLFLSGFLKENRVDVYFAPSGILSTKIPEGCISAVTFQNMLPFAETERKRCPYGYIRFRLKMLKGVLLRSFRAADKVIFISEYARSVVKEYLPDIEDKSVVIYHGINEHFYSKPDKAEEKDSYYLYVSIIDFYKAQLELVKSWKILKDKGFDKKLYLVGGEYARYSKKVRAEIIRLGLEEDVILKGKINYEELPDVYKNARALIYASSCENCPYIMLESMAAGKLIFCSDYQPMPEFGEDGVIYFHPYKPETLAEKILEAEENADFSWYENKAYNQACKYSLKESAGRTFEELKSI